MASCRHSLTPQFHSCSPRVTRLPFPQAGFPCCYLNFFHLPCWHCLSPATRLTDSGAEVLLRVMLNPMVVYFSIGKDCTGATLCPLRFRCCTVHSAGGKVEQGAVGTDICSALVPWGRPAGWPCSIHHCKGLGCPGESLGKSLRDCDGHWVGGERDTIHCLHPPSQRCRTTSNKTFGGTRAGAHADEI